MHITSELANLPPTPRQLATIVRLLADPMVIGAKPPTTRRIADEIILNLMNLRWERRQLESSRRTK